MIITFAGFKGGVGKTTAAVHLAGVLATTIRTVLLVDADPNRSSCGWSRRGSLPFTVLPESDGLREIKNFQFTVLDTEARPNAEDLQELAAASDLLILPTTPDALAVDALVKTLSNIKTSNYRILLTMTPPPPGRSAEELQQELVEAKRNVFNTKIRRFVVYQKAAAGGCLSWNIKDPKANETMLDFQNFGSEVLNGKI